MGRNSGLTGLSVLIVCFFLLVVVPIPSKAKECLTTAVSKEHSNSVVVHILKAVAKKMDADLTVRQAPFARRLCWMRTGEIDLMGGLLKRPEREDYIYYVMPPYVTKNRKVFFVRKGDAALIARYEDLYGYKIGTKIGSQYFPRFDRDPDIIKEPTRSVALNFKKLIDGRIDAVVYSLRSGLLKLHEMDLVDQVDVAEFTYLEDNPVYIGISRKSRLLHQRDKLEKVVREMVESGEVKTIIADYYADLRRKISRKRQTAGSKEANDGEKADHGHGDRQFGRHAECQPDGGADAGFAGGHQISLNR